MYIDPQSIIAGAPALSTRNLMRRIGDGNVSLESLAYYLKMDKDTSQCIRERLSEEGYIELNNEIPDKKEYYKTTLKGNSLALASAAKPLTRKTAEKKLAEFMGRVTTVNSNEYYLYKITKVIIFGSYLSEKDRINDIDVAVTIQPKFEKEEQLQKNKRRIEKVEANGKHFSSFVDQLFYPEMEALKHLKSRSRAISIHRSSDGILDQVEQKVIYEENSTAPDHKQ